MIIIYPIKLAHLISRIGGVEFLVEMISTKKASSMLPAIMAVGYIAGHSGELAWTVIKLKV